MANSSTLLKVVEGDKGQACLLLPCPNFCAEPLIKTELPVLSWTRDVQMYFNCYVCFKSSAFNFAGCFFPAVVRWHCCLPVIQWQLEGFRDKDTSFNKGEGGKEKENFLKVDNVKSCFNTPALPFPLRILDHFVLSMSRGSQSSPELGVESLGASKLVLNTFVFQAAFLP